MLRIFIILSILFCFTFATFEGLVKLCFEKTEITQTDIDSEDNDSEKAEKEADFDKVFLEKNTFIFAETSISQSTKLAQTNTRDNRKKRYFSISTPPPEV